MDKILKILKEIKPEANFDVSQDYINDGLLDSFDMVTLVSELEEKFDILIDALDILPENFANAKTIAEVVKKNGGKVD
ncbi:MAG: acyl carrier protein [Phascolarctobacterium sp.]|nr:acyl carrier protein [Candidatus Phascolarctobacterium caballi]